MRELSMDRKTSLNAAAPAPLRLLLDGIERLGRLDGWIGAACLVTLTLLMLAEIAVRALSNFISWVPADIPIAWEYSSYLMAACFTFGAAMTLRAGGHIRVTLVLGRLEPPARRILEIAASLIAAACSSGDDDDAVTEGTSGDTTASGTGSQSAAAAIGAGSHGVSRTPAVAACFRTDSRWAASR